MNYGNRAPEPLANQQFWKNWSEQNQGKLAEFQANRAKDWNNISEFRNNQNVAGSFNQPEWNDFKNNVQNYRDNRAIEVTNNIQNSFNNHFNSDWWKDHGGYSGRDYAEITGVTPTNTQFYDKYGLRRKILVVGRRDVRHGCDVAGFRQRIRQLWKLRLAGLLGNSEATIPAALEATIPAAREATITA